MARATREIWAKRVERWADSGLTAEEFAKETGINPRTLAFWKWQLARRSGRSSKPPGTFVEVHAVSPVAAESIEVIVRDGVRIRVPAQFDVEALRKVVAAVEGR